MNPIKPHHLPTDYHRDTSAYYLKPVDSNTLQAGVGIEAFVISLLWLVFYTFPRWNELVSDPISEKGNWFLVFVLYLVLIASQWYSF